MAVVLVCLVAVAADPSQKFASSRGLFVDWVSDPSSLRVGALVGMSLLKRQAFLKTLRSSLSRKENEEEEEKKTNRNRRPWSKPSVSLAAYPSYILRTHEELTAIVILEKQEKT